MINSPTRVTDPDRVESMAASAQTARFELETDAITTLSSTTASIEGIDDIEAIADVSARAPDGTLTGEIRRGRIYPETLWWDDDATLPLVPSTFNGPTPLIAAVIARRASLNGTELWNQCYRISAKLLAHFDHRDVVQQAYIQEGVYRTVDGDTIHFWVEAEHGGDTYICETHTHRPCSLTGERGGVFVTPEQPEKYVPTGETYSPDDLRAENGPQGDPRAELVGQEFRSADR